MQPLDEPKKATGVAGLYIDDHADNRQVEALPAIIGGRAGGFPGWVNECFAGGRQSRGIERAKITYEIAPDLGHWGVEIVGRVKAWAKAIIGPTSPPGKYPQLMNAPGSETGPGPQLVTWGKSTILSIDAHGFKFEDMLNAAKHAPRPQSGRQRAMEIGHSIMSPKRPHPACRYGCRYSGACPARRHALPSRAVAEYRRRPWALNPTPALCRS